MTSHDASVQFCRCRWPPSPSRSRPPLFLSTFITPFLPLGLGRAYVWDHTLLSWSNSFSHTTSAGAGFISFSSECVFSYYCASVTFSVASSLCSPLLMSCLSVCCVSRQHAQITACLCVGIFVFADSSPSCPPPPPLPVCSFPCVYLFSVFIFVFVCFRVTLLSWCSGLPESQTGRGREGAEHLTNTPPPTQTKEAETESVTRRRAWSGVASGGKRVMSTASPRLLNANCVDPLTRESFSLFLFLSLCV